MKMAGRRFTGIGKREDCEIPDYCRPNLDIYREAMLDAVAETSEEFMERYFAGDEFSVGEIRAAMKTNVDRWNHHSGIYGIQCRAEKHSQSDE